MKMFLPERTVILHTIEVAKGYHNKIITHDNTGILLHRYRKTDNTKYRQSTFHVGVTSLIIANVSETTYNKEQQTNELLTLAVDDPASCQSKQL